MTRLRAVAMGCVIFLISPASAAPRRIRSIRNRHSSQTTLRKRLHVNDLITEPGTVELDWGGLYSFTTMSFTLPSAVKFTPGGDSFFLGRTEYSVAFDSVDSAVNTGARSTQFSDRLTFAATSIAFDSTHFDIAVAPQATIFLRGDSGMRLGATVIARYDGGGNSIGATAGWTAATSPSDSNPAGTWDFGIGAGHRLRRFTPHVNVVYERSTGFDRTVAAFGGVEYQLTGRLAFDVSGQRLGWIGDGIDRQILVGMTLNLGNPAH